MMGSPVIEGRRTEADAIVEAAATIEVLRAEPGGFALSVPHTRRVQSIERLAFQPPRRVGEVCLSTLDSFIQYVKRNEVSGRTTVWARLDETQVTETEFVAVFNDTLESSVPLGADEAPQGWRDDRAIYSPVPTREWLTWSGKDRARMSQREFAQFLEENLDDVHVLGPDVGRLPSGADMLEMSRSLEITSTSRLRSHAREQSGSFEFTFIKSEDDATVERMKFFDRFCVLLAPFQNGPTPPAWPIPARLRYRAESDGKVVFWYELIRPDKVLQAAVGEMLVRVRNETGVPVLEGLCNPVSPLLD